MNIFAVYNNYTEFDKIYTENITDTRLSQIIEDKKPAIIVTQEKKLNQTDNLKLIASSTKTNGTNICRYCINDNDIEIISVKNITVNACKFLGNEKGVIAEFKLFNKTFTVNSLHCKDFTKIDSSAT